MTGSSGQKYNVTGRRVDGSTLIVAQRLSLPIAERTLGLIRYSSLYTEVRIEPDDPSHREPGPPPDLIRKTVESG